MDCATIRSGSSSSSSSFSYNNISRFPSYESSSDISATSTPHVQNQDQIRLPVDPAIIWNYEDAIVTNNPLKDFVKTCFKFTDDEIDAILKYPGWKCPAGAGEYKELVTRQSPEVERYFPFEVMMNNMINQISEYYDNTHGIKDVKKGLIVEMYDYHRISNNHAIRGPDGLGYWRAMRPGEAMSWALIKVFFEINVALKADGTFDPSLPDLLTSNLIEKFKFKRQQANENQRAKITRSTLVRTAAAFAVPPKAVGQSELTIKEKKKRSLEPDLLDHIHTRASKRPRFNKPLTTRNIQMPLYALESLAAGARRWTFGVFVDAFEMTLWYFDRLGAIHTQPFNFLADENRGSLALLVAGLTRCSAAQAGFEPLINEPGSITAPPSTHVPFVPAPSYDDAEIVVPKSINKISVNDLRYRIVGDEPLYGYRGTIGRGTIVYAVKALKGRKQDRELVVKFSLPSLDRPILESSMVRKLRTCEGLRGMRKYLPKIIQARVFSMRHMLYPRFSMDLGRMAREEARRMTILVLPKYHHLWELKSLEEFKTVFRHLVECHYYCHSVGEILHRDLSENNLMWKYEDDGDDIEADEVYEEYPAECERGEWDIKTEHQEPASSGETTTPELDDSDEIKDLNNQSTLNFDIKSELDSYNVGADHSELPEGTPSQPPPRPAVRGKKKKSQGESKGKPIGILGDWDLSTVLKNGVVPRSAAKHRTGTQPFMAVDLLADAPPPHLYRHDLESFLWVLLWAMVNYDLKGHRRIPKDHPLSAWESDTTSNSKSKRGIIEHIQDLKAITDKVRPAFQPLIEEWVTPLVDLFADGFTAQETNARLLARQARSSRLSGSDEQPGFDNDTLGGNVTFEKFMEVIGRTPMPSPRN
ncbi:hypothetical protein ONZ45_g5537 [Pleurotus djamor]|nr:hypothetical protein ONZ45_g5537 [Pleurotus djamor]